MTTKLHSGGPMKTNFITISLSILVLSFMTSCASLETAGHKYIMRGQILESTSEGVYLCIGSGDGAEVGQELEVYKFVITSTPAQKAAQPKYKREETGTVKITEIVDEHYAKAKILTGQAKENSIVELHK